MKKISFILLSFIVFPFPYTSCNSENTKSPDVSNSSISHSNMEHVITNAVKQLSNNQVCMVNNKFMGKDQIQVPVDGKTYYGCCPGCVSNLKSDTTYRFASDPETGERVDKSDAIIILKRDTKDEVLYFKTETNAKKYIEKQIKINYEE